MYYIYNEGQKLEKKALEIEGAIESLQKVVSMVKENISNGNLTLNKLIPRTKLYKIVRFGDWVISRNSKYLFLNVSFENRHLTKPALLFNFANRDELIS